MTNGHTIDWLLDSDPALRWQVERDVLDAPPEIWRATRARVATEGQGARLLARQDADGQWSGGAYFPAEWDPDAGRPQPWTTTTWALNDLREWGVDPTALRDTAQKLAENCRWEYQDMPYWSGEVDVCMNSWTLSNGLWLGVGVDPLVDWLLARRLADGGWNCEWVNGATVSSYHSTLNALIGLLDYQLATGDAERVRDARHTGEEYLLSRGLFRRRSTGRPVEGWAMSFAYPRRWVYHALAAADYFRAASLADGTTPDPRMSDLISYVRAQRRPDGTWLQGYRLQGDVWEHVDVPGGEPSKWITLQAVRVLDWWGSAPQRSTSEEAI